MYCICDTVISSAERRSGPYSEGVTGVEPPHPQEKSKTCSRMHQNAPFRRRKCQNQTSPPSTPSAPPFECLWHSTPPDHISGYGPDEGYAFTCVCLLNYAESYERFTMNFWKVGVEQGLKSMSQLRFDYDTTIPRRIRLRRK